MKVEACSSGPAGPPYPHSGFVNADKQENQRAGLSSPQSAFLSPRSPLASVAADVSAQFGAGAPGWVCWFTAGGLEAVTNPPRLPGRSRERRGSRRAWSVSDSAPHPVEAETGERLGVKVANLHISHDRQHLRLICFLFRPE